MLDLLLVPNQLRLMSKHMQLLFLTSKAARPFLMPISTVMGSQCMRLELQPQTCLLGLLGEQGSTINTVRFASARVLDHQE